MNLKTQAAWMWMVLLRLSLTLVVGEYLAQALIRKFTELAYLLHRSLR